MKFDGKCGDYFWIEWREAFLGNLLSAFPQIVIGKYLINTSFDSGSLTLADEEIKNGWSKHSELTLSPPIQDVSDIPYCNYDEWYIFDSLTTFEDYEVFVNYYGFSLEDFLTEFQERFWRQIESFKPRSFLAEGDYLIYVTKDESLFKQISLWEEINIVKTKYI